MLSSHGAFASYCKLFILLLMKFLWRSREDGFIFYLSYSRSSVSYSVSLLKEEDFWGKSGGRSRMFRVGSVVGSISMKLGWEENSSNLDFLMRGRRGSLEELLLKATLTVGMASLKRLNEFMQLIIMDSWGENKLESNIDRRLLMNFLMIILCFLL